MGRPAVTAALAAGHIVTAQSREAARLDALPPAVRRMVADPGDDAAMGDAAAGQDAVLYALGHGGRRPTTFFSDTTRVLIAAMLACTVPRLVAITGVGAGETRGHGGFVYDRLVFPFVTRQRYADKERQEALIAASGLDWTVLRPAPFVRRLPPTPLEIHATVAPDLVLRRITREEAAALAVRLIDDPTSIRRYLFAGHR